MAPVNFNDSTVCVLADLYKCNDGWNIPLKKNLLKNFKGMNSVQVYIGLFRNKACNMHINVGGREAGQQWCQTVSSWFCFQCRMLRHLFNENLDYEQTFQNLHTCPISSHSNSGWKIRVFWQVFSSWN